MHVHLLVLNYNGRRLLETCLPSIVEAARASRHRCEVAVIDNDSDDDSIAWLIEHFPEVHRIRCANRGLCSFNQVLPILEGSVAILLNNDIKLAGDAIDPLVEPLAQAETGANACFMTAPLCWQFDGKHYEGFRTAIRWRWGLVQATALFPGHETGIHQPGPTASAGAVMAVDRRKFVALGGFDPLYLPGRLEDLDLCLRAYLAGYHCRYVPKAVAWHRGMATFSGVFGTAGCDRLSLRNTLLFQWKNLRHPGHLARQLVGLPARLVLDVFRAPWTPREHRWAFTRALFGALRRVSRLRKSRWRAVAHGKAEKRFFDQFHPSRMRRYGTISSEPTDHAPSQTQTPTTAKHEMARSPA